MIRKLFAISVFTITVTLSAFGQNIFGRDDLIAWAVEVEKDGPSKAKYAWQETDKILASLSPEAGSAHAVCSIETPLISPADI